MTKAIRHWVVGLLRLSRHESSITHCLEFSAGVQSPFICLFRIGQMRVLTAHSSKAKNRLQREPLRPGDPAFARSRNKA